MNRRNTARMTRVPGLQQRQSCRTISDFANNDSVRFEPQRNLEALELVKVRCGQHAQTVRRIEEKLLRVFNHQHAIAGRQNSNLFKDRICNRRLASPRSTDDEYVLSTADGFLNHFNVVQALQPCDEVFLRSPPIAWVVFPGENPLHLQIPQTALPIRLDPDRE